MPLARSLQSYQDRGARHLACRPIRSDAIYRACYALMHQLVATLDSIEGAKGQFARQVRCRRVAVARGRCAVLVQPLIKGQGLWCAWLGCLAVILEAAGHVV